MSVIILCLQDARLLSLENEFEAELSLLEAEFNAEREEIVKQVILPRFILV
jgi:hypothetical protein